MSTTVLVPMMAAVSGRLGTAPDPAIPWLRIAFAFLFCVALATALILLLRRRQGMGSAAPILTRWLPPAGDHAALQPQLEGRLRLSPASQIVTLRWDDTRYLIHVSATGAVLLDRRAAVVSPES